MCCMVVYGVVCGVFDNEFGVADDPKIAPDFYPAYRRVKARIGPYRLV